MILGGAVWMLFGFTLAIPYLGRLIDLVFKRIIKLAVLIKLLAWCVGASGLVSAYFLFYTLYGPPDTIHEWWIIAGVAAYAILRLSHRIIMLEFYDIEATLRHVPKFSPKFLKERMPSLAPDEVSHLVRRNFADVNLSLLLQLLVSFGMLFFALSNLHVLPTNTGKLPTLVECMAAAFSLIGFVSSDTTFTGPVWLFIRLFAGIVLFVWVIVFVTLAINSIPSLQVAKAALGLPSQEQDSIGEGTNTQNHEPGSQASGRVEQAVGENGLSGTQLKQSSKRQENLSEVKRTQKKKHSRRNRPGKHK